MVSTDLFIPPEPVKVLGGRHPLTNEHRQVEVRAGATIAEALDISIASTGLSWPQDRFVATVNDVRVPREWWHRVRPKPGTMVVFRPVASGDDSLRTILFLGIAVAALFIAPFIAGPAVLGLTGAALQAGTALIGGAITLGGALLLNALMPLRPPQQDTGQPKTLPMIQGASNEVRPWGSVPVILGRHRISPPYAAMPYSHFTGQKQYMSLLFAIGYGPVHIEPKSLKIGETSIDPADSKFEEIETEIDEAFDMEKLVKLFKRNVNEIPLGLPLKSALAWEGRTTGDATNVISLDVIAPAGIWIFDKKTGKYKDRPVTVNVQYRKNVPGQPVHVGAGWIKRPDIVFHLTRDTYRMGAQWNVTPAGLWDVRLRKATADYPVDGKEQVADAIIWQTLRGFQTGVPITFPQKLALIGMNARASDQFNGVINTFNCVVQSYVWGYNGTSWVANQLSSNPADLFHHVLTGPANARPRKPGPGGYGDSSGDIDYDSIQRWWQDCHTYGYTYNAVISDQRTVREVLSDIAAAGRATVALRNGKWGVSFPRIGDPVSWHFTPRNSSALKTTRTYREMPHALRVRYIDGSAKGGWKQTEGIVYNDTLDGSGPNGQYTATTAHLYETVEFPGITDWGNIHKAARFQLAQALLRPETHTLNADIESLRLERGDKVILSTETLLIGTGYGRVVSVNAATQTVIVDSRVIMVPGKTYQVKFTIIVSGAPQILQRTVLNSSSETDTLQLSLSDPIPLTLPVRDNLFSFGETALVTRDYRVLDVRPAADLTAQFTLVDDAPGIEFLGNIPDYDPGVDGLPDPFTMVPQSVTFNESFSGSGITAKSTVQLTVQIPRVGTIRAFEFQSKDVDNSGDWTPFAVVNAPLLTATKDNMEPGAYQFRVRALFREDYAIGPNDFSAWVDQVTGMDGTKVDIVQVHNLFDLPPDVENFRVTVSGDTMRFDWDAVASPILAFYRLKYNTATDRSALWGSSVELATPSDTSVSVATRSGTFLIKAVTYTQAESQNENDIIVVTTAGKPANIVSTLSEAPYQTDASPPVSLGSPFPGYFFSTKVQSGLLLTLGVGTAIKDIVTNQGLTTLSSNTRTISQILVDLSITTGLKLLLETGTTASWPGGAATKWLDESGGGYDFFLGLDGTVSATDPTFVGTVGDKTRNAYWNFDGGDYFTYDAANEAWMNAIHKDNALATVVFTFSIPTLGSTYLLYGTNANSTAQIGSSFYVTSNKLILNISNGSGGFALQAISNLTMTATGWHTAGFSVDEAAGTVSFMLDGVTETLTRTYASPSAAAATYTMQIGANGNSGNLVPNGVKIHSVVMWQSVALTVTQMAALGNAILSNDDIAGLKLLLESGTVASWPGTGQKWLDESGNGYDFFLGSSGTASPTDPAEPSFVGTVGDLTRNAYWNFDGGDYFTYDTTNEIWMDHIHKAGTKFTAMMSIYVPTLGSLYYLLGNCANDTTKIGFNVFIYNNQLQIMVLNGTGSIAFAAASVATITTTGWHVVGISFDETAGIGTFMLDGVVEGFTGNYTSPSVLPSSYPLQIGAAGNSGGPLFPSGTRLRAVGVWEGLVLGDDQMIALAAVAVASANYYLYTGSYQFYQYIDLGSVYTSRITANVVASGLKVGDTIDHWARLSDVTALNTVDPSAWSVEMVYLASNGPTAKKSVLQMITDQNLLTGVKLVLESAALASWPNTGQNWFDESGGHYDFILGATTATSPTETSDPGFIGDTNTLLRTISHWYFDGGDYFTYKTTNETWMDAIHKDNAKFTAVVSLYVPALDTGIPHYLLGNTNGTSQVGFQFMISSNQLIFITTNGATQNYAATSGSGFVITAPGWHTVGVSVDEAAGTGIFMIDGVTQAFSGTYTSPSAAASTLKLNIGAAGAGTSPLANGWRVHAVAMWQTVALTAQQLTDLGNGFQHNEDWVYGDWTPFGITDVTARIIIFGIHLTGSPDGSVSPAVSKLSVTIDMPDRHEGFHIGPPDVPGGSGTGAGGYYVKFDPPFKKLTDVALSNFDLNTTERYTLTQRDEHGVVVTFYASTGAVVSKTFDLHAYGYGEVVSS